jgi:putative oxidoreductase
MYCCGACTAGMIAIMFGTIFTVHSSFGFFMNWDGTAKGEGIEFYLVVIGLAIVALLNGSGRYSVDYAIQKKQ